MKKTFNLFLFFLLLFTGKTITAQTAYATCDSSLLTRATDTTISVTGYGQAEYWMQFKSTVAGQRLTVLQGGSLAFFSKMEIYSGTTCANKTLLKSDSVTSGSDSLDANFAVSSSGQNCWVRLFSPVYGSRTGNTVDFNLKIKDIQILRGSWIEAWDGAGTLIEACANANQNHAVPTGCILYACPNDIINLQSIVQVGNFSCDCVLVQWSYSNNVIPLTATSYYLNPNLIPLSSLQIDTTYPPLTHFKIPANAVAGSVDSMMFRFTAIGCSTAVAIDSSLWFKFTISTTPTMTLSVTPNPTCQDVTANAIFTGGPVASYIALYYDYGNGNGLTTVNTNSYLTAGTYTVSETAYFDFCSVKQTEVITVVNDWVMTMSPVDCSKPLSATVTFADFCFNFLGGTTFLVNWGDGANNTYTYNNAPVTATHGYATAGTYTVTVSDTYIPTLKTFTITVYPLILPPKILTTALTECSGTNALYQANSPQTGVTYSWTLGIPNGIFFQIVQTGSGNNFIVDWNAITQANPNSTFRICLTASTPNGCSQNTCLDIIDCCINTAVIIHTSPNSSGLVFDNCTFVPYGTAGSLSFSNVNTLIAAFPNGTPITNQTIGLQNYTINSHPITILNSLTINTGANLFTFSNCNILLNPYAQLVIKSNTNLTDDYLNGCTMLWDKIDVQAILTVNRCVIEDGATAINKAPSGTYKIQNSIFNKNDVAVLVNNNTTASLLTNSFIKNTAFTSRVLPNHFYPTLGTGLGSFTAWTVNWLNGNIPANILGNNTIPNNIHGETGVSLTDDITTATGMNIGDNSLANGASNNNTNVFDILRTGISVVRTKVNIVNNRFINMRKSPLNNPIGGVFVQGNFLKIGQQPAVVNVGGATAKETNLFYNDSLGVVGNTISTLTIQMDSFSLCKNAVLIKNWQFGSPTLFPVSIKDNAFNNCTVGIFADHNTNINCGIFTNTFRNIGKFANATAINIVEFTSTNTGAQYNISQNNPIHGMYRGIICQNTNGVRIDQNKIVTRNSTNNLIATAGVGLINCMGTQVTSNNFKTTSPSLGTTWNYGLFATISPSSNIQCNNFTDIARSIQCEGVMPSHIWANKFVAGDHAVYLNNACDISSQDNPNYTAGQQPQDDLFNSTGYTNTFYTTDISSPQTHTVYYRSNSTAPLAGYTWTPTTLNNGGTVLLIPISPASIPAVVTPPATQSCNPPPTFALFNNAQQIALGQQNFGSIDPQAKFMNKRHLFHNIKMGNINVSSNTVLSNFMVTNNQGNYNKFFQIDSLIGAGITNSDSTKFVLAQNANGAIATSNGIESNQVTVNGIYLSYLLYKSFSGSDYSTLQNIALLCPYSDGTPVFQARGLLAMVDTLFYINPCEQSGGNGSLRLAQNQEAKEYIGKDIKVYPNPANNLLNLSYEGKEGESILFELFNILGEKIKSQKINYSTDRMNIDVADVNEGTYLYRVTINNELKGNGRVVIIK